MAPAGYTIFIEIPMRSGEGWGFLPRASVWIPTRVRGLGFRVLGFSLHYHIIPRKTSLRTRALMLVCLGALPDEACLEETDGDCRTS